MYSARFEMSNGKTYNLSYENGILFDISPINGIDVSINKSQGYNQTGETVESQSVAGVSRQIMGVVLQDLSKKVLISVFSPFQSGKIIINEKYYCDFVVQKGVEIKKTKSGKTNFSAMVFCPNPYWFDVEQSVYSLTGVKKTFSFPTSFDVHKYGESIDGTVIDCYNDGEEQPLNLSFVVKKAESGENEIVFSEVESGRKFAVKYEFLAGDVFNYYVVGGIAKAEVLRDGEVKNVFRHITEDSDFFTIKSGHNYVLTNNSENLKTNSAISFYPMRSGLIL